MSTKQKIYIVWLLLLLISSIAYSRVHGPATMQMNMGTGGAGEINYADLQDSTGTLLEDSSGQQLRSW